LKEVDEMIAVMGQPEDYHWRRNAGSKPCKTRAEELKNCIAIKRKDARWCSTGLGYYFGVDAVWMK
jgi:hypothetical protein